MKRAEESSALTGERTSSTPLNFALAPRNAGQIVAPEYEREP
jgi:hypothetical protein